jgi:hypothetical protein
MNPRLPALASISVGLIGLALTAVVWPIAVPLGIFALALYAVTRIVKPTTSTDRWFATGGLLFGLLAVVLGAAIAINDSGGDGGSTPKSAALTFVNGIATATPDSAHPPQNDIENPLPCRVEIGALRAGGKITNNSGAPADYRIIVVWEEDGTKLANNTAVINNVAPGLTSSFEVSAPGDGSLRTTCRVDRVDRTPTR